MDLTYYNDHSYPMTEFVFSQLQFGVLLDLNFMCKKKNASTVKSSHQT